ncbi:MAG: response regulator transcription factor [Bacteroidales bacterium]|jgi:DNA-binding NarL/FixJ family response regulator|nr:response regulator transcription factor [Bacteroidales bacterium]
MEKNSNQTNILIVDDHNLFGEGLASIIESIGGYTIVGIIDHGNKVIEKIESLANDKIALHIVLLDLEIPGESGSELVGHIKEVSSLTSVVILSMHNRFDIIHDLYESGISGYVLKNMEFNELRSALESIKKGKTYFSQEVVNVLMNKSFNTVKEDEALYLTQREKEVLDLIVEGKKTNEIAGLLFISKHTVESHRKNLLRKFDVHNALELVRKAFELKIIQH